LLHGFLAYASWDIFNNKKLATMFQCIGNFSIYHCFFHLEYPFISTSEPKIDPQIGVRLVEDDDLHKRSDRITALNVQWTARFRVTKNKTARPVLVIRIVFNHVASAGYSIFHLGHADVANDALIDSISGKFILVLPKFCTDFMDHCHGMILPTPDLRCD